MEWKWLIGATVVTTAALTVANFAGIPPDLTKYELAQNCIATPQQINKCIGELTAKERANIKGEEIAKIGSVSTTNVKFSGADYDIEITDIKAIAGGVEIFARAWDTNGQVGFGKDGSVDIERFYIINPPIMVDDPKGDVVREWTDERTGELKQRKLRESPQEAILQSLAHTVSLTDNKPRRSEERRVGKECRSRW